MFNKIKKLLVNNSVKVYQVEFSEEQIEDGVRFESIEGFLDFVKSQNINVVFYNEYFDDNGNYLITEELIEETLGKYNTNELIEIISKDVNKYNKKISKITFNEPSMMIVGFFMYSQFFYVWIKNDTSQTNIDNPAKILEEILSHNQKSILKKKEEKQQLIEKLKYELSVIIKNDKRFLLCTNKRLRVNYIKDLLSKGLNDDFTALKEYWLADTPQGIYQEAIDFIEFLWKETQCELNIK